MQICHLEIKNFRGLEDVQAELLTKVSVIVGPNAAGKTTIMEAIRLVKSLLAPRTQSESSQVLFALGAASPHAPQRLHFQAVARDASRPVIIGVRKEDVRNKDIDDISEILLGRIERLKGQLANVDSSTWRERFKSDVEEEVTQVKKVWEATWKEQCDGKRLIEDLSKSVVFQTKIRNFKIRMIKEMAINQADGWKTIERQLRGLFS